MKTFVNALLFFLSLHTAASALDPFSLSLQSPELAHLRVGSSVVIEVVISGLPAGASLDYVAATVMFDVNLLGTPIIAAGSAVPDVTGFTSIAQPGLADGLYDALAADSDAVVSQSGALFSFSVTPLATGAGQLRFDFVDALGSTLGGVIDGVLAGEPIPYLVEVPEPATASLIAIALAVAWRPSRRRSP